MHGDTFVTEFIYLYWIGVKFDWLITVGILSVVIVLSIFTASK